MAIELTVDKLAAERGVMVCTVTHTGTNQSRMVDVPLPVDGNGDLAVSTPAQFKAHVLDYIVEVIFRKEKDENTTGAALNWITNNVVGNTYDITADVDARR